MKKPPSMKKSGQVPKQTPSGSLSPMPGKRGQTTPVRKPQPPKGK